MYPTPIQRRISLEMSPKVTQTLPTVFLECIETVFFLFVVGFKLFELIKLIIIKTSCVIAVDPYLNLLS